MKPKERKRYGVWQLWLTKSLQGFRPVLSRVAKKNKLRESEVIREAVLLYLSQQDKEGHELYQAMLALREG
jgi:hypothetical protein